MVVTYKGVVRGSVIVLEDKVQLPEGALVQVTPETPVSASSKEAALQNAEAFKERILARRGGKKLPGSSADLIREARQERTGRSSIIEPGGRRTQ